MADNPIVVSSPTWKKTSFARWRANAAASAPNNPSGTTMITEIGTVQLSYNAARLRNTTRIDSAYKIGADDPDNCSCNETPVHSWPTPAGRSFIRRSISAIACPVLCPAAACPWISADDTPLKRSSLGAPQLQCPVANEVNGTMDPVVLRT